MTFAVAATLGIVEGITEFLPISSTGHLTLTQHLLKIQETDMLKSFDIAIQLGAILAVVILYFRTLVEKRSVWVPIIVAFIPTAIFGALLHGVAKEYLLGNSTIVGWSMLIGGIVIVVFEYLYRSERGTIQSIGAVPLKTAVGIGLFQSIAIIPGVSRAAATIIGGMLLKVERRTIVEFSFLLAIPTMAAATGYDLLKSYQLFSMHDVLVLGVGFVVSFMTAILAIHWLLQFVQSHSFTGFGIYRILAAIAFWMWVG